MTDTIKSAIDYLQETQDKMMEDYKELLRFASISADPAHAGDVRACADWIVGQARGHGLRELRSDCDSRTSGRLR